MELDDAFDDQRDRGPRRAPRAGDDADDGVGEVNDDDDVWLGGLVRAGLPVRARRSGARGGGVAVPFDPSVVAVREPVGESWAPATRRAYEASWLRFALWCDVRGLDDPLLADEHDVAEWVAVHVTQGLTPAYLARQLAALTNAFELAGRTPPTRHPLVRRAVAGARHRLGTAQRRATPLRLDELRRIVTSLWAVDARPHTHPVIRRDRALLLVAWAGALRAGELVALDVADLSFHGHPDDPAGGGMIIRVRRSETDGTGDGAAVVVPFSRHGAACPVRAVMVLARQQRIGPLFRHIDRHAHPGARLRPTAVTALVKRRVADVLALDPALYSSHSLRAGCVTEMRARGVPDRLVDRHTRHRDAMLHGDVPPADPWRGAALVGEWW